MGQFGFVFLSVAESLCVAVAGIFVAEPSVVEQKHIHAELCGIVHKMGELFFIEVEICCFPVVEDCQSVACAVFNSVLACPRVQISACFAFATIAICEDEIGCFECLFAR